MPTVTYNGASYACTTAIKGDTYIRLLDAEDAIVASFEGITDLSKFGISGGSWSNPEDLEQCCLVVMRRDGTLVKTTKKVCDVGNNSNIQTNRAPVTPTTREQTIHPDTGYDAMSKVVVNAIPSSYVKPSYTQSTTEWTPGITEQSILSGTYCSGKQTIKGDTDLVPANIKSGVSIFGVLGEYSEEGRIAARQTLYRSSGAYQSMTFSVSTANLIGLVVFIGSANDSGSTAVECDEYALTALFIDIKSNFHIECYWQADDDDEARIAIDSYSIVASSVAASNNNVAVYFSRNYNIAGQYDTVIPIYSK